MTDFLYGIQILWQKQRQIRTCFLNGGIKKLARGSGIAFDSSWFPVFNFKGQGNRASDDFFYEPYTLR